MPGRGAGTAELVCYRGRGRWAASTPRLARAVLGATAAVLAVVSLGGCMDVSDPPEHAKHGGRSTRPEVNTEPDGGVRARGGEPSADDAAPRGTGRPRDGKGTPRRASDEEKDGGRRDDGRAPNSPEAQRTPTSDRRHHPGGRGRPSHDGRPSAGSPSVSKPAPSTSTARPAPTTRVPDSPTPEPTDSASASEDPDADSPSGSHGAASPKGRPADE